MSSATFSSPASVIPLQLVERSETYMQCSCLRCEVEVNSPNIGEVTDTFKSTPKACVSDLSTAIRKGEISTYNIRAYNSKFRWTSWTMLRRPAPSAKYLSPWSVIL